MHYIKEGSFLPSSRIVKNTLRPLFDSENSISNYNGIDQILSA
jgi:hypothetical protein